MAGRNRSRGRRTQPKNNRVAGWQWVLSVALVLLFAAFLFFLRNVSPSVSETVALKPRAAAETRERTAKKQSTATKKPLFEF